MRTYFTGNTVVPSSRIYRQYRRNHSTSLKPDQKEISNDSQTQPSKRVKTSIIVDENLWREWGAELRRKGLNYTQAIEITARDFVEGSLTNPKADRSDSKAPTRAELHQLLDEIIDDGTLHIAAIQANLELLAFACRFAGAHSMDEIRALRKKLSEEKMRKKPVPKAERSGRA
jgi:hypothetical protein